MCFNGCSSTRTAWQRGSKKEMKIVCTSDTHDIDYPELPDGDILLHAGDVTLSGVTFEVDRFLKWFKKQPHKHKIFVGGNHDRALADLGFGYFASDREGITFLDNSFTEIEGIKIWGSGASRTYGHITAFMHSEEGLGKIYSNIPDSIDILISHTPAYGVLDTEADGRPLGSTALAEHIFRVKPKMVLCGHIHGGYGEKTLDGVHYINASHLDVTYRKYRPAIVYDLDNH